MRLLATFLGQKNPGKYVEGVNKENGLNICYLILLLSCLLYKPPFLRHKQKMSKILGYE